MGARKISIIIIATVLAIIIDLLLYSGVSCALVLMFDWIFGTTYFCPEIVGILALIFWAVTKVSNNKR